MDTMKDRMFPTASVSKTQEMKMKQDIKDWAQYSQNIAAAMTKRMVELGLTQRMLAEKMNCTQQYISKQGSKNLIYCI